MCPDTQSWRFMNSLLLRILSMSLAFSSPVFAGERSASPAEPDVPPEMVRLAHAMVGHWKNVETMERSRFFPSGGERTGLSTCRLATAGTNLVCEGDSDGSAGPLHHLIVIWWDVDARLYRFFTCFREGKESHCKVRGTAHWEGEDFVNDYAEEVDGKPVKMRDSFLHITHDSHLLVAAMEDSPGHFKTMITTRSTRR